MDKLNINIYKQTSLYINRLGFGNQNYVISFNDVSQSLNIETNYYTFVHDINPRLCISYYLTKCLIDKLSILCYEINNETIKDFSNTFQLISSKDLLENIVFINSINCIKSTIEKENLIIINSLLNMALF